MLERMLRIRRFEETVIDLWRAGELPGMAHLSIGQEAAIVGACLATNDRDTMTGNHRSHGHPIGKGAKLDVKDNEGRTRDFRPQCSAATSSR